jgi:hypothetical protein
MNLGTILDALYESEINCSISSFWDGGFDVRLWDEMNGFVAETNCKRTREIAEFLDTGSRKYFPESSYALGHEEWERSNQGLKHGNGKPDPKE